ncbi:MAG: phosphate ABC transporter permease PstA [Acidobacteriota bacterium]|nr:MAG: phosphate ABC transporter permease PstA [Acidobacteriota bacterium]
MDSRRIANAIATITTAVAAFAVVGVLIVILGYISYQGISSLSWQFLVETPKPVGEGGGIGNAIVGSLIMLGLASLLGVPIGVAVGTYLSEMGDGWFGSTVRFVADTLIGVPSIVFGVFIYALVVLQQGYFSTLAGSLALALIMIPIITRTTEEMTKLVPKTMREGALALGAPQWRVTLDIVLPAAMSGIATGIMLSVARVLGETAPLLFTAFGSRFYNIYLDEPMAALTVQIYNYAISPFDEWHDKAWAATMVLVGMILLINISMRYVTRKRY